MGDDAFTCPAGSVNTASAATTALGAAYDATDATQQATCCTTLQCGDVNGDGTADDAFTCPAGSVNTASAATTALGAAYDATDATQQATCCTTLKCGDVNGDGTADDAFTCPAGSVNTASAATTALG